MSRDEPYAVQSVHIDLGTTAVGDSYGNLHVTSEQIEDIPGSPVQRYTKSSSLHIITINRSD